MSSRHLHPIACRLPRAQRDAIVQLAFDRGMSISGIIKEALSPYLTGVHPGVSTQADSPSLSDGCRPAPTPPNPTPAQPETLAEALTKRLGYSGTSSQRVFTDKPSSFCPSLPQRAPQKRDRRPAPAGHGMSEKPQPMFVDTASGMRRVR
jgi:hypothetical protein